MVFLSTYTNILNVVRSFVVVRAVFSLGVILSIRFEMHYKLR